MSYLMLTILIVNNHWTNAKSCSFEERDEGDSDRREVELPQALGLSLAMSPTKEMSMTCIKSLLVVCFRCVEAQIRHSG